MVQDVTGDSIDAVHRENTMLLMDIARLCQRSDRRNPETILLIGKIGCGKSALVNTIIKAITGQYIPKAAVGAGGDTQSKTIHFQRYYSCGVDEDDFVKEHNEDCLRNCLLKLPTILDVAGLGNVDTPELQEILEMLIGGFIPDGTSIAALDRFHQDYYIGALKDVYKTIYPGNKVSKIIFVQSCQSDVPVNLINCLRKAISVTNPTTNQIKCNFETVLFMLRIISDTGEIYVVITKYDMVMEDNNYFCDTRNGERVKMKDFEEIENRVANNLNILGALEFSRIRWISYTDKVGFDDNPHIDNIALKFLKRMLQFSTPPPEVVQPVITPQIRNELKVKKLKRDVDQFISCPSIFFAIIFLIVAFIVYLLLMAKPTSRS